MPEALRAEGNKLELLFQWHDRDALHDLTLYPPFLKDGLRALPEATQHIVRYE